MTSLGDQFLPPTNLGRVDEERVPLGRGYHRFCWRVNLNERHVRVCNAPSAVFVSSRKSYLYKVIRDIHTTETRQFVPPPIRCESKVPSFDISGTPTLATSYYKNEHEILSNPS
ncbi:hypothetical protein TNCV_2958131 [Trichonephila clavipes]|nr:hypothetical protein TNCV_2958131 [Trichonephila clavipes]